MSQVSEFDVRSSDEIRQLGLKRRAATRRLRRQMFADGCSDDPLLDCVSKLTEKMELSIRRCDRAMAALGRERRKTDKDYRELVTVSYVYATVRLLYVMVVRLEWQLKKLSELPDGKGDTEYSECARLWSRSAMGKVWGIHGGNFARSKARTLEVRWVADSALADASAATQALCTGMMVAKYKEVCAEALSAATR